jgi:hypothetical protein
MTATLTDKVISNARDLPSLVSGLQVADPALAEQITGKALIASKTPWGTLAVAAVSWGVSHYGLGWDANTCALVGGLGLVVGSYVMRAISSSPIKSWFIKPTIGATP